MYKILALLFNSSMFAREEFNSGNDDDIELKKKINSNFFYRDYVKQIRAF